MAYALQQLINGLTLGAMYGLIAIGYTMVYGIIGMINFAHGEVFMVGAYAGYYGATVLGIERYEASGQSFPLGLALVVLIVAMATSKLTCFLISLEERSSAIIRPISLRRSSGLVFVNSASITVSLMPRYRKSSGALPIPPCFSFFDFFPFFLSLFMKAAYFFS